MTIYRPFKGGENLRTGDNIRLRSDGRYEARYIKRYDENGKAIWGYSYGKTYDEVNEKIETSEDVISGSSATDAMEGAVENYNNAVKSDKAMKDAMEEGVTSLNGELEIVERRGYIL